MKLRMTVILGASVVVLVTGTALPAYAAPGDTTVTFTLTGGSLSVTPQAAAELSDATTDIDAIDVQGNLGLVTVADYRGGTSAWNVSAAATQFADPGRVDGSTSAAVEYTGGVVDATGTVTVPNGTLTELTTEPVHVLLSSNLSGNNTATWTPLLYVDMPAGALAGSYAGTITTSVL